MAYFQVPVIPTDTEPTEGSNKYVTSDGIYKALVNVKRFEGKVWGFRQTFTNLDPDTCITYLPNTENANYAAAMTNLDNGTVTIGGWKDFINNVLHNKPYMVTKDAISDYALYDSDYSKKSDGSTASDYANTDYTGAGAFAWLSKLYMREDYALDGSYRDVYFSDIKMDGFHNVGFLDEDDNDLEGIWLPMGYMDANGKCLVTGTTPIASKTTEQEWTIVQTVSTRARFLGGPIINFLRDLEFMIFKSTDIQKRAGYGRCNAYNLGDSTNSYNRLVPAGSAHPAFYGNGDKKSNNKIFHSQVLQTFGQWLRDPYTLLVNGIMKTSHNYKYDITGASYDTSDNSWHTLNAGWHYSSYMEKVNDNFGSVAKKQNNASTSTGIPDGLYCNTGITSVAIRFGSSASDLIAGPCTLHLGNVASSADWHYGVGVTLLPRKGYKPF